MSPDRLFYGIDVQLLRKIESIRGGVERRRSRVFESIGSVLSGIKQAGPVVLMGVAVATGVGLFATDWFIAKLGLLELRNQHRAYVGGAFVLSSALLAAQGLAAVAQMARRRYRRHRLEVHSREALHALTPDEKAYLLPFVIGGQNTLYFRAQDGVAGGLIAKKILYQSSTIGSMLTGFAHNLQPWAREYLEKHPQLLEGANPEPAGPPRY